MGFGGYRFKEPNAGRTGITMDKMSLTVKIKDYRVALNDVGKNLIRES